MTRLTALTALALTMGATACQQTTIAVITEAPPGFEATIDATSMTLRLTRGLTSVVDCTSSLETYVGPCVDLAVDVTGDAVDVFDAHLDADGLTGRTRNVDAAVTVSQPPSRAALAIAARDVGESVLTLRSTGPTVTLTVTVVEPPSFGSVPDGE